jgi:hypothetical protein
VPFGALLSQAPTFTLYGDNRAIFRPTGFLENGDPLPFVEAAMSAEQVDALLEFALGRGRLEGASGRYMELSDRIADGPTTVFAINAAGIDKIVTVYALGIGEPPRGPVGADYRGFEVLSELLSAFEAQVQSGNVLSATPYEPELYRAAMGETNPAQPGVIEWPWAELTLDDFPPWEEAPAVRVGALTAAQAALVTAVPSGGTFGIPILAPDGLTYALQLRPLLPGEPVVPDLR